MKYRLKYFSSDRTWHGPTWYDDFFMAKAVAEKMQQDFGYAIEIEQSQPRLKLV